MMLKLYDYWRSSASYRVRIALNLKGTDYETVPVNIAPGTDEHLADAYKRTNPQMRVPSLEIDGQVAGQSMAIIEWIDETLPGPARTCGSPDDVHRRRNASDPGVSWRDISGRHHRPRRSSGSGLARGLARMPGTRVHLRALT